MSRQRQAILTLLFLLTVLFLSIAAYTFFGVPVEEEPLSDRPLQVGEAPQALRLTVEKTGIAAITAGEVRASKMPIQSFSADGLRLTRNGESIPFYVQGDDEEATLYFFAETITRSVEAPAVYWLEAGRGKTMSQRDHSPDGPGVATGIQQQRWEENSTFQPMAAGDDSWFGQRLFAPGKLEIPLTGIHPTGGPGQLSVRVWSSNQSPANPDHHLQVWLNGHELPDHFWDGIKQETLHLDLPAGVLKPATNLLVLNVPGDTGAAGESIFLDWIRLEYEGRLNLDRGQLMFHSNAANIRVNGAEENALIFDVSDPLAPVLLINTEVEDGALRLSGTQNDGERVYVALNPRQAIRPQITPVQEWEEPLRETDRGADYVAIVPAVDDFDDTLQPLLDHRRAQGLRISSVPLQQIYDEFAHGRARPEAIRDFLAHAAQEWHPPPRFVLLVGDASYDVRGYMAGPNRNLVPTYLIFTEFAGYMASDSWFTMFEESAPAPSMAIGRLPAQSAEQLAVMVRKTIDYESTADTEWRSRALLVADDELRFNASSEWLAQRLYDTGYQTQKLYMTENEDIRDAIISAVNHGVGILNYVGHGGIDVWGDEMVLEARDARMMLNDDRLPIFTTFTCLNGYFNHPNTDALAETLLWTADGGVVAAIAPSGRTFASQQTPMANLFYQILLNREVETVGETLRQAKATAVENANLDEVIHAFNLLGDPALRFQMPAAGEE